MKKNQRLADMRKNTVVRSRKGAKRVGTVNKKLPRKKSSAAIVQTKNTTTAKQLLRRILGPEPTLAEMVFFSTARNTFRGKERKRDKHKQLLHLKVQVFSCVS